MKILNKLSFFFGFLILFVFSANNNAWAPYYAASVYKVTVYRLSACVDGSTLSECESPAMIGHSDAGVTMDIAVTDVGASAGSLGNINNLKIGTKYTYGEVVIDRQFTMKGEGADNNGGNICRTDSGATAGDEDNWAVGVKDGGTPTEQTLYVATNTSQGLQVNSTDQKDGLGSDSDDDQFDDGHLYMKFRWELKKPYVFDGMIPSLYIEFDVSRALGIYGNCLTGGNNANGITPEKPIITNYFQ